MRKIKTFSNSIGMEVKEKPPDEFFKCVKVSLKHIIKHYEINQPKINNCAITPFLI